MQQKIGFIGCGNMGKAILIGLIKNKVVSGKQVYVANLSPNKLKLPKDSYGFEQCDNKEVAQKSDVLILAIKPNLYGEVIKEIKTYLKKDAIIVCIAAGIDIKMMEAMFDKAVKVARVMPNTCSLVNMGMSGVCFSQNMEAKDKSVIKEIFGCLGKCCEVREEQMDGVIALSGSGPAYCFMYLDAVIKGGVRHGLSEKEAKIFALQTIRGVAQMVEESEYSLDELIQQVCSPKGTTIEAVKVLQDGGFSQLIVKAMDACVKRAKAMIAQK